MIRNCALIMGLLLLTGTLVAQKISNEQIKNSIERYKEDPRGPYKEIRWFCEDGSIIPPKETCPDPGGVQRANYKNEVKELAKQNHVFLGQILATTEFADFWDASSNHSRLKQYQLENYLKKIDDGWVNRKGQYYRGAYQIEDEMTWGIDFYKWLLNNDALLRKNFFLIRQSTKDIPHKEDNDRSQRIRALSKILADEYPPFMDLRIKIHGQPDASDLGQVIAFNEKHQSKLTTKQKAQMAQLIADMQRYYAPIEINSLDSYLRQLPKDSDLYQKIADYIKSFTEEKSPAEQVSATAELMLQIRNEILNIESRRARLALLDLSLDLEDIYFKTVSNWKPQSITETAQKILSAGKAATGAGFIELWEWAALSKQLEVIPDEKDEKALQQYLANARRLVEWGAGMTRAVYQDVIEVYQGFEPKAYGFTDDRVRSSVLLDLGNTVGKFGELINTNNKLSNQLLNISNASHARGLNPGIALGELVVMEQSEEDMEVDKNKIYVFNRPPSDLKPVAGIATVTEGNMVSHVQLLARNLAIPNAVISDQNFSELKAHSGEKVFYAVAASGRIIIKPEAEMNETERALFEKKERDLDRIKVPVERIDLAQKSVLNMRNVNAASSGITCGPKAANLGQLKAMFPEQVVEGIVVPFGIFREHMDQEMPEQAGSYWQFLNTTFQKAGQMREDGSSETEVETYVLTRLETLREAIKTIKFTAAFQKDLKDQFENAFGKSLGEVPVFIRSDTNMEDLKDFTGAGLNLTLFNIVDEERIVKGIKEVWASPYTERSFKWRQRYLLNPENVFPSILIIPSVDVDFSGVLITKGITSGKEDDLTLAISRGAGGAVDGQAAEAYLLKADGDNQLLTPAREPSFRRLPQSGGTSTNIATFEQAIANAGNLKDIRALAKQVEAIFPEATNTDPVKAYDIEFGFKDDKLWLFQIRPFVESKNSWEVIESEPLSETPTEGSKEDKNFNWWIVLLSILTIATIAFWVYKSKQTKNQESNNQTSQS